MLSWMFSFLHSLFAFIVILVPLVVFHEFGHFIFARIFGVKAEIFSVGFGPKLWSRKKGETEFRVSAIPLGGYVKLLGEDRETKLSPSEQKRALHYQKPWKRFFIFFGGPFFNFILAVFIFMLILMIGEPHMASVVGRVVKGSTAERAGFQSGDQILTVNGKPVNKYEELLLALNESPGETVRFTVLHNKDAQPVELQAVATGHSGFSIYGEAKRVGEIEGLFPMARSTQVGVSNSNSIIARQGVETGDQILQLNQQPLTSWEDLERFYEGAPVGTEFELLIQKGKSKDQRTVRLKKANSSPLLGDAFGLYSSELFVEKVVPKSPAEAAGIQTGDRLVGIGNKDVQSFFELKDAVQQSGEKEGKVHLKWERDGRIHSVTVEPTATSSRDPVLNRSIQYTVGVMPMLILVEPKTYTERVWNPFKLVYQATERVVSLSWRNLVSLRKMLTGDVSMGAIGGPISIGKIAGESLTRGLIAFLTNMAIFSIGLGVLNILPVPVLDGGHLMLLGIEMVRGKPLTLRQMEIVQGVGLIFILALMGIAFHNDIARLFYS